MSKLKVMTVFGVRPEAIKMAPLILELQKHPDQIESIVCVTAQHRQMLDQVLDVFNIRPDYDLDIMQAQQSLNDITIRVLQGLEPVLKKAKPDIVLVHGDTLTTFLASYAAFMQQIPVGHVEAGLRTWNKLSPYPEEMNRQLTGVLADLHFAPTEWSANNLKQENKKESSIYVTGNTITDVFQYTVRSDYTHEVLEWAQGKRLVLMTAHRRESQGEPHRNIFQPCGASPMNSRISRLSIRCIQARLFVFRHMRCWAITRGSSLSSRSMSLIFTTSIRTRILSLRIPAACKKRRRPLAYPYLCFGAQPSARKALKRARWSLSARTKRRCIAEPNNC